MSRHGCPLPESDGDGAGLIQAMLASSQVSHCKWFPLHCRGINPSPQMSWAHVAPFLIPKHFHMAHGLPIPHPWLSHLFLLLLVVAVLGARLAEEEDEGFVRQLHKALISPCLNPLVASQHPDSQGYQHPHMRSCLCSETASFSQWCDGCCWN